MDGLLYSCLYIHNIGKLFEEFFANDITISKKVFDLGLIFKYYYIQCVRVFFSGNVNISKSYKCWKQNIVGKYREAYIRYLFEPIFIWVCNLKWFMKVTYIFLNREPISWNVFLDKSYTLYYKVIMGEIIYQELLFIIE